MLVACTDRFERRLAEETSALRVQIAELGTALRQDIADMSATLRTDIANGRVELFKWCFLFWIGQASAIGTLMGVMLRLAR